jgi:hypothetical protein
MATSEWEIPPDLQPSPADHAFDLDEALRSVVAVKCMAPPDAFTAQTLGTERTGSGVVIRPDGLIATIGYLVTEARPCGSPPTTAAPSPATRSPTTSKPASA